MEDFKTEASTSKSIFETINDTDPRLALLTDTLIVPVIKGADQITSYIQKASSASSNGLSFNVILPALDSVLAPVALIKCKMTINFTTTSAPNTGNILDYGNSTAFAPYPLHSMFDIVNATFNSAGISWECGETLDMLKN